MNYSLPSALQSPQSPIRIGYVGSAFPLVYEKIGGELSGIHVELWQTALRGREIQWEKRTVYGSYEPDESGFFDGMLGEMQKGTLDIALQETRMDKLYYTLPVEEWEENFYESQETFFDPAIVVVPFSISFTAILVALFIAMSITEVAVRAVISKLRGKTDSFWISCNSMTILGALFHRLAIIFILIIYNAAFVGLATSPGIEPTRWKSSSMEIQEVTGRNIVQSLIWKRSRMCYATIQMQSSSVVSRYSITHNDPDTPYKHQCAFKIVDSSDVSFLPSDSEVIKLGIGKKFLTTFHMSRNVSRAIRERFSFVQLTIFDRDIIDNFWWRRYTNQPRIIHEKSPTAFYQSIGLAAFETIFIVFGSLILIAILIFISEIVYARFFPRTHPRVQRGCRFIGYVL